MIPINLVKPRNSFLLVKKLPPEDLYNSLIALPENRMRSDNVVCEVVAVGPGQLEVDNTREEMGGLKSGDYVVVHQQSGRVLQDDYIFIDITEADALIEDFNG